MRPRPRDPLNAIDQATSEEKISQDAVDLVMCDQQVEGRISSLSLRLEECNTLEARRVAELPAFKKLVQKRSHSFKDAKQLEYSLWKIFFHLSRSLEILINIFKFVTKKVLVALIVALSSFLIGSIYCYELYSHRGFAKVWLQWEEIELHAEQCTIEMPASFQDAFRPPANCGMCQDVTKVDRVSGISPEIFELHYAYTGRPAVIEDGQKNWTAPQQFSFTFFKNIYQDNSPALASYDRNCQFFPYDTEFHNLWEVFNMSEDRANLKGDPWYIGWSNCDSSAANALRQHYQKPYFLPKSAESSKTDWIFMGSPGYGAHLHIDHVGNPSWQAQIKGKKQWLLEPPPECYFECIPLQVTVNAGEIIVLDTNVWYHSTHILPDELSITIGSEYD